MENKMDNEAKINFWYSLRSKLLLICLGLSLTPIIVIGLLSFVQSRAMLRERIEDEFSITADLQVAAITQWLDERKDDVVTLAETPDVQSMDQDKIMAVLKQRFDQWGIYQNIFILTPDGNRVFDTAGSTSNLFDRDYFQQAMQGRVVASDILISRTSDRPIIVFAAPVRANGEVVGVAGAVVQTTYISGLLEQSHIGKTGDAYLVNRDGYFITAPRFADELREAGLIEEFAELEYQIDTLGSRQARSGIEGVDEYEDYRGNTVLGAYRYIGSQLWALVIEQDQTEAFAATIRLQNMLILIALCTMAIVVVLAFWFSGSIANPIMTISQGARYLSLGDAELAGMDWDKIKKINARKDELGVIGHSFNGLTAYFRETATAARHIAAGDLDVKVEPKGSTDLLGNAFVEMMVYLQGMAASANRLAEGDLTTRVTPQSEADVLGNAFAQMITNLRELVREVQRG
ncbi:MAG: HAMP domain-containing protein, partial [Anaerolineae bacterium]|nr:HAMP domain-containing protein [Anaerolineae bacterium]